MSFLQLHHNQQLYEQNLGKTHQMYNATSSIGGGTNSPQQHQQFLTTVATPHVVTCTNLSYSPTSSSTSPEQQRPPCGRSGKNSYQFSHNYYDQYQQQQQKPQHTSSSITPKTCQKKHIPRETKHFPIEEDVEMKKELKSLHETSLFHEHLLETCIQSLGTLQQMVKSREEQLKTLASLTSHSNQVKDTRGIQGSQTDITEQEQQQQQQQQLVDYRSPIYFENKIPREFTEYAVVMLDKQSLSCIGCNNALSFLLKTPMHILKQLTFFDFLDARLHPYADVMLKALMHSKALCAGTKAPFVVGKFSHDSGARQNVNVRVSCYHQKEFLWMQFEKVDVLNDEYMVEGKFVRRSNRTYHSNTYIPPAEEVFQFLKALDQITVMKEEKVLPLTMGPSPPSPLSLLPPSMLQSFQSTPTPTPTPPPSLSLSSSSSSPSRSSSSSPFL